MPIHYEADGDHVVRITIDRPEARNSCDMEHFKLLREAWERFAGRRRRAGRDRHRRRRGVLLRCGPEEVRPRDHQVPEEDRGRRPHRDRRLPPRRRHARGAAELAALQAGDRRGERVLHRGRHGDARRHRHPHRVPGGEVRGDGAEARAVRGRRHDRAPAAPDPLAAGDGVPALRRPHPGRPRVRDGRAQRGRAARAAARQGARVRGAHRRQRAARGAGDEAERVAGPLRRRGHHARAARRGEAAARSRRRPAPIRRRSPRRSTRCARSCARRSRRRAASPRRSSRPRTRRKVRRRSPRSATRCGKRK